MFNQAQALRQLATLIETREAELSHLPDFQQRLARENGFDDCPSSVDAQLATLLQDIESNGLEIDVQEDGTHRVYSFKSKF